MAPAQKRQNPAIPGWHSDPSCVFVSKRDNTTFCASSTFLLTLGIPIMPAKISRPGNWLTATPFPEKVNTRSSNLSIPQTDGIWAPTLRYQQGIFCVIVIYMKSIYGTSTGLIFNTRDPFSDDAWTVPIQYNAESIDPDFFWDDDGTAYVATAGTNLQTVDVTTGALGEPSRIWNDSTEYFQNIGHADLFHNANGHWWSCALAWRSGSEGHTYLMSREMVLTSVIWKQGDWPSFTPVRGNQKGWYLPPSNNISLVTDLSPITGYHSYTISPPGHPRTLRLTPSTASITSGYKNYTAGYDGTEFTLIMRRQTDTLFQYSVDVSFAPTAQDEEVGVTVFLNQVQNINLGIVMLPVNATNRTGSSLTLHFRFLVSGLISNEKDIPTPFVTFVPHSWLQAPIRLMIRVENETLCIRSLVGVYATSNNGKGATKPCISRWRYSGLAQEIGNGEKREDLSIMKFGHDMTNVSHYDTCTNLARWDNMVSYGLANGDGNFN
ncbi:uncharacterized protein ASPGLDRAFT_62591 [Aspergillus glaucus CBS 516.65]|uniref:Beta-xylosidase C-terminal Concanavalin A-like domain-containing protein n=1 Tax=Aspergillus glaucus CBS 516.65 TaxID=1160497 RepID=A0A1L9VYJ1_ASPGL|nr:hypothetical protein ASPGLDRAFT_62591 [Aspergillus glaucus CBS 516.65]OJJ88981.1 hypothetical protein ASPGLDRAFT_62591 [Aspergillus glaucus CBS 516.65]